MKETNKVFLSDRADETGSICWSVEKVNTNHCYDTEASIRLYDCNRSVTLDFDCFDTRDLAGRVEKANIMLEEITKFRDALLATKKSTKFFY